MSDTERTAKDKRRRQYAYRYIGFICKEAGLGQAERIDLARELLSDQEGVTSYSDLSTEDLEDILFVLKGWRVIQSLRLANGSMTAEAMVLQMKLQETAFESAARQDREGSWN